MHTEFSLISTLAWGLGLSLFLGFIAARIGIPALVGYLLAGICIAPTTPGFVGDLDLASQLSEVGVMLLMFGVGLHFSLRDLLRVKTIALPGAIIQMAVATVLGTGVAYAWGWSLIEAFILGLSLSCASTVVLLKGLEAKGWLQTSRGQLAVGWLVVEDLVTVLLLVLMPTLASVFSGEEVSAQALTVTVFETTALIIGFIASMLLIAKRLLPWALMQTVRTGSSELFTLCVIAIAIGVAYASSIIFNVSFALGAFFAGMMMRESEYSHRAALQTLPLQDAFSVLFFLGVGMLFDPRILIDQPLHVLAVVFVIVFCKSITAMLWVRFRGRSHLTALTVGMALSQVGEFSFILAGLGVTLDLLPPAGMSLILAAGLISIALNPLMFALIDPLMKRFFPAEVETEEEEEAKTTIKRDRVLIVGAGVIGQDLFFALRDRKIESFVIEKDIDRTHQSSNDEHFIYGDAATKEIYEKIELDRIRWMVITSTDPLASRMIVETISSLDDEIRVIALVDRESDIPFLQDKTGELINSLTQVIDIRSEVARTVLGALMTSRGLRSGAPKQLPKREVPVEDASTVDHKPEKPDASDKSDKTDKSDKVEKSDKAEKTDKADKAEKAEKADKPEAKALVKLEDDKDKTLPDVKEEAAKEEVKESKAEQTEAEEEHARKSRRSKKKDEEESESQVTEDAAEVKAEASDEEKTEEEPARKSRRGKKKEEESDAEVTEEASEDKAEEKVAETSEEEKAEEEPARKSRRGKKKEEESDAEVTEDASEDKAEEKAAEISEEEKIEEEPARKSRRGKKKEEESDAEVTEDASEDKAEEKVAETSEEEKIEEEPARKSRRSKKKDEEESEPEVTEEVAEAKEEEKAEEEPARKSRRGKKKEEETEAEVTEESSEDKAEEKAEASDEEKTEEEPARKSRRGKKKEDEPDAEVTEETSEDKAEDDKTEASEEKAEEEPARKSRRGKKKEEESEAEVTEEPAEAKAEEEAAETSDEEKTEEEPVRKSRRSKKKEEEESEPEVTEEVAEVKAEEKAEASEEEKPEEEPARKSRRRKKSDAQEDAEEAEASSEAAEEGDEEGKDEEESGEEPARKSRRRSKKAEAQEESVEVIVEIEDDASDAESAKK